MWNYPAFFLLKHTPSTLYYLLTQTSVSPMSFVLFIEGSVHATNSVFLSCTSMYPAGGISAAIYTNRLRSEGMGSKDNAVLFDNQDYESLKRDCLESGCLFEDPCFPAEPPSLGFKELAPHSSKTRDVEWIRPTVKTPNLCHTWSLWSKSSSKLHG